MWKESKGGGSCDSFGVCDGCTERMWSVIC